MSSILVPIDFSINSALALEQAIQLADDSGFSLEVVYVFETPVFERFLVEEIVKTPTQEKMNDTFLDFMAGNVKLEAAQLDRVNISFTIKQGNVITCISESADKLDPWMAIIGSQGSGTDHWNWPWLGGTAQKIIRHLECPVLIVPPNSKTKKIESIAFAADFNDTEDHGIIERLIKIADRIHAKLNAVHVNEGDGDDHAPDILIRQFDENMKQGRVRFDVVKNKSVSKGLHEYVLDNNISMVALSREKLNLFERIFDRSSVLKIAFNSGVPTLMIKEN